MKRIILLALGLWLGFAAPSWALLRPEISLGARVGLALFDEDDALDAEVELDQAPVLGATLGIRQRQFGGELSVDWIDTDLDGPAGEVGELRTIPILITGRFHFLAEDSGFDPYAGLGVGYYLNDFDARGADDVDIDNAVGFHLNVGANLRITSALSVALDARYVVAQADADAGGGTSAEVSLNSIVATAGVRYSFPR